MRSNKRYSLQLLRFLIWRLIVGMAWLVMPFLFNCVRSYMGLGDYGAR